MPVSEGDPLVGEPFEEGQYWSHKGQAGHKEGGSEQHDDSSEEHESGPNENSSEEHESGLSENSSEEHESGLSENSSEEEEQLEELVVLFLADHHIAQQATSLDHSVITQESPAAPAPYGPACLAGKADKGHTLPWGSSKGSAIPESKQPPGELSSREGGRKERNMPFADGDELERLDGGHVQSLSTIWEQLDTDRSGGVTVVELKLALAAGDGSGRDTIGSGTDGDGGGGEGAAQQYMEFMDENEDHVISVEEWLLFWDSMAEHLDMEDYIPQLKAALGVCVEVVQQEEEREEQEDNKLTLEEEGSIEEDTRGGEEGHSRGLDGGNIIAGGEEDDEEPTEEEDPIGHGCAREAVGSHVQGRVTGDLVEEEGDRNTMGELGEVYLAADDATDDEKDDETSASEASAAAAGQSTGEGEECSEGEDVVHNWGQTGQRDPLEWSQQLSPGSAATAEDPIRWGDEDRYEGLEGASTPSTPDWPPRNPDQIDLWLEPVQSDLWALDPTGTDESLVDSGRA